MSKTPWLSERDKCDRCGAEAAVHAHRAPFSRMQFTSSSMSLACEGFLPSLQAIAPLASTDQILRAAQDDPPNRALPPVLPSGYDERKELQLNTFMFDYFPLAWLEVAKVAVVGNRQHNPGEPLHWAREKSNDQGNTAFRHRFDHEMAIRGCGSVLDTDGCYHLAKTIWRDMAALQLLLEGNQAQNAAIQESSKEG